jgi:uncharacterized OsmC-like protein
MELETIGHALNRVISTFERRPSSAIHADSCATVTWKGGLRTEVSHPNGATFVADMPAEFGGGGAHVTPGWFMRAGAASCTATCVVIAAAQRGIKLTGLEIDVTSRSDARGNLGMRDEAGRVVDAGPRDLGMRVRISAENESPEALEELVKAGVRSSSVVRALEEPLPISLQIEIS